MRRQNVSTIGDLLKEFSEDPRISEGLQSARVLAVWDEVLYDFTGGYYSRDQIAKITLKKYYKDRVLTCKLSSSMIRMQIQMNMGKVLGMINSRFGQPLVEKIVLQ